MKIKLPLILLLILSISIVIAQNHPEIVRLDNGKLKYKKDGKGNQIPDFSAVGYKNGEESIPNIPVVRTLTPVSGDNRTRIQNAINEIQNRTPDKNGFRGALLLKKGEYKVGDQIKVTKSGVLIIGEGDNDSGTRLVATKKSKHDFLLFSGASKANYIGSTEVSITNMYLPVGAKQITVQNASGFKVGDRVMLKRTPNHEWIKLLKMDKLSGSGASPWKAGEYQVYYKRKIVAINGNTITLDAPNVDVIDKKYAKGSLGKYTWNGRIENVGVENIRFISHFSSNDDENHAWSAVVFNNVEHGWARNIEARYFGYGTISIDYNSSNITVEDARNLDPKSKTTGGRKYSFNVNGQRNLIKDCYSRSGRHDYVTGARVAGPNVFLRCKADNMRSDIGPHHRWSTGILFDNVTGNAELNARNRTTSGSGHGWTGAQIMYWNSKGARFRVQDPPGDHINWCIGCKGSVTGSGSGGWSTTHPVAYKEFQNATVTPLSLYEQQLKDRLGSNPGGGGGNNPPTVSISSPKDGQTFQLGETIALAAGASDPDGNLAHVNFKVNDSFYSQDNSRPFEGTFTPTAAGTYKIGARAFDSQDLSTEVFVTITVVAENKKPSISITSPMTDATYEVGEEIPLTVNASDSDGSIDKVQFLVNGAFYRQDSDVPYSVMFVPEEPGMYEIVIKAIDNSGAISEVTRTIEVQLVTNLQNGVGNDQLIVYPNPSKSGVFHLNELIKYTVIDAYGTSILQKKDDNIDLSIYADGIYYININNQVYKIIKQ